MILKEGPIVRTVVCFKKYKLEGSDSATLVNDATCFVFKLKQVQRSLICT